MADHLPLLGIDYIELYVGNAKQFAYYLSKGYGFQVVAYAGMETGVRDKVSYVLEQGDIRLVVTGALSSNHPIAEFVKFHGDGVKEIAFVVDDAAGAYQAAVAHGAIPVSDVQTFEDADGFIGSLPLGHTETPCMHWSRDRLTKVYSGPATGQLRTSLAANPKAFWLSIIPLETLNSARWSSGSITTRKRWDLSSSFTSPMTISALSTQR